MPRVALIGASSAPDSMEWHIVDSLDHLGCPVSAHDVRRSAFEAFPLLRQALGKASGLLMREPERRGEKAMVGKIAHFQPDLVLVVLGNQLSPKTVALLRTSVHCPVVCWCQDQMTTMGRQYLLGAGYDAVFLKDRYLLDLFSRMVRSTRFHYLPEACNPRVHQPAELSESERKAIGCDVMIAGTLYYYRQEILKRLANFQLKVYGDIPDWLSVDVDKRTLSRPIFMTEKARAIAAARLCLNTLHFAEVNGLNCRAFELAGCGALQLISAVPVLSEHFVPEVEVVAFSDVDELVDKARYFLNNPDRAKAIGARAHLRAHREHTYEHRLLEIFRVTLGSAFELPLTPRSHGQRTAA
jgi:spore maturation protein CgeB